MRSGNKMMVYVCWSAMMLEGLKTQWGRCTNADLLPACLWRMSKEEKDAYLEVKTGTSRGNVIIIF